MSTKYATKGRFIVAFGLWIIAGLVGIAVGSIWESALPVILGLQMGWAYVMLPLLARNEEDREIALWVAKMTVGAFTLSSLPGVILHWGITGFAVQIGITLSIIAITQWSRRRPTAGILFA